MPRRLHPCRGGQGQRDIPPLLQTQLGGRHPGQTPEGGPKAGRAVGLPAPTPRENPQQRSPPHPTQVPAVGRLPAPPGVLQPPHYAPQMRLKKGNISQGYSILISQNHQSQTSIEDAFFSGSGLADKKHFTVHVEHRFKNNLFLAFSELQTRK